MKKTFHIRGVLFLSLVLFCFQKTIAQGPAVNLPRLQKNGSGVVLLVHNKPFFILGGELGKSSAASLAYMKPVWPKLKQMNLNTVFTPVYWELLEPQEGMFDFSILDSLLADARSYNLKLVLLWFGAWKNSMSCYAPAWVKLNAKRFPRALDKSGNPQEILTPFNKANLEADKKAFVKLMQHIRQADSEQNTVIAVQVENEIGMLPDARTYDEEANKAFAQAVPENLLNHLQKNSSSLLPELKGFWQTSGANTKGNWETVFGNSLSTDETFMAWYYAVFVQELVADGKNAYPIPMYVNAALNRPGAKPGQYPSAGPLPHLMDVWKAAALGHYNCLSFSPFSIESTDHPEAEPIGRAYGVLNQLTHLIAKHQPAGNVDGFMLQKDSAARTIEMGDYRLTIKHDYTLGWSPGAKDSTWPVTGGLVVMTGPSEFYIAGTGLVTTFETLFRKQKVGLLSVEEGHFQNETWTPERRLNGDQTHQGRHVRIPANEYNIQHVKLYTY